MLTCNSFGADIVHFTTSRYHTHCQFVDNQNAPFDHFGCRSTWFGALVADHLVHNFCKMENIRFLSLVYLNFLQIHMGCAPTLRVWEQYWLSICAERFHFLCRHLCMCKQNQHSMCRNTITYRSIASMATEFHLWIILGHSEALFSCQIDSEYRENDVTRTKYTPSHPIRSHLFTLRKSIFLPSSFGERKINKSFSDVILSIECIQAVKTSGKLHEILRFQWNKWMVQVWKVMKKAAYKTITMIVVAQMLGDFCMGRIWILWRCFSQQT